MAFYNQSIYLSVIVPAYNESKIISSTLKKISDYLVRQPYSYEIIVVNDGSDDNTAFIVRNLMGTMTNLHLIDREVNKGKGYSVREGMLEAKGKIRLFTDADNSTDVSHFEKMELLFKQGYKVVIGSRNSKDAPDARRISPKGNKLLISYLGNIFIRMIILSRIYDTQAGFKAFESNVAEKIFLRCRINGWGFDIEVLALAKAFNCKIGIIPLNWVSGLQSKVKFSSYFQVLRDVLKIRWNLFWEKYE